MRLEGPDQERFSHVTFRFTHHDAEQWLDVFQGIVARLEELQASLQGVGSVVLVADDKDDAGSTSSGSVGGTA